MGISIQMLFIVYWLWKCCLRTVLRVLVSCKWWPRDEKIYVLVRVTCNIDLSEVREGVGGRVAWTMCPYCQIRSLWSQGLQNREREILFLNSTPTYVQSRRLTNRLFSSSSIIILWEPVLRQSPSHPLTHIILEEGPFRFIA